MTQARPSEFFDALRAGKIPVPACARTLGIAIDRYDAEHRTVYLTFEGRPEFANPVGKVQGGFMAAMLDDAMGVAASCTLGIGQFAPTLALNLQFHRPAEIGRLEGVGRVTLKGSEVLHLAGELFQNGKLVASSTATALIRKS